MSAEEEIIETVQAAKKPGTFKIMDVLQDRAFPTEEVEVYLDEESAYLASQIDNQLKEMQKNIDKSSGSNKELKELNAKYEEILAEKDALVGEIGGSKYVFHLTGISEGKREDLYDLCLKEYPMEYETERNPFTGQGEKKEVESAERDKYFTNLVWQAHIAKIVAPDGSEQEGVDYDEAVELRRSLPLSATTRINSAIEKLRTATAVFLMSVNEDFLAKSSPGTTTDGSKPS